MHVLFLNLVALSPVPLPAPMAVGPPLPPEVVSAVTANLTSPEPARRAEGLKDLISALDAYVESAPLKPGQVGRLVKVRVPGELLERVAAALADENEKVRSLAPLALSKLGIQALPHLGEAVRDGKNPIRSRNAAWAFKQATSWVADGVELIPHAVWMSRSPDVEIRSTGAFLLARYSGGGSGEVALAGVADAVFDALRHETNPTLRELHGSSLWKCRKEVLPKVLRLFEADDPAVQGQGAGMIAYLEPLPAAVRPDVVRQLERLLFSTNSETRRAAEDALRRLKALP